MKNVFVQTANVKEFSAVCRDLVQVDAGVPGMALVYGKRGLGKTRTAIWYAAREAAVYIRAKRKWTATWLMEELCVELQLAPVRSFRRMFQEVCATLTADPKLILVDEVDLISSDVLETIRDVHDITGTPIVLIGMEKVKQRLIRFGALYDRLLYVRKFGPLSAQDIRLATGELMAGIAVDSDVLELIREKTSGNFRKSIVWLKSLERGAKANNIRKITMAEVEEHKDGKN